MSSDNEGTCRLCSKLGVLRNSHIVPEFMYKPVYLEHRMIGFKESKEGTKEVVHQKGLREYLLCDSCEGHLNTSYECPNVAVWEPLCSRGTYPGLVVTHRTTGQGTEIANVTGVDYAKLKLLLLSILWRASVSKRREYSAVPVLALGNFDGLHRGHMKIIDRVRRRAGERGGTPAAMTFDPHPSRVLRPDKAPPLLMTTIRSWMPWARRGCKVSPSSASRTRCRCGSRSRSCELSSSSGCT